MLLDDTMGVEEVFCEHHEDVLLKHTDGSFTGQQVKTRDDKQPPWKARDPAVLAAFARFARLESEYPGKFRCFCFLTNHPLQSSQNGQDLCHILHAINDATSITDLKPNLAQWVKRIAQEAGVSEKVAFAAMSKSVADASLPKLRDAFMRLIDSIVACWPPASERSHALVKKAAQALIDECTRASSLDHEQILPAYMVVAAAHDAKIAARINGKRINLARVLSVLEQGCDSAATLTGDLELSVEPGDGSTELLQKKLDAGGFSIVSRISGEDLRDKADYLAIAWTKKYGQEDGLRRYDHILSTVQSDAGRAFDATQTKADGFGPEMREDLRLRFSDRRAAGYQLYDCTDEHLEGFAFSLTAQCKIVWSHARPWESK